MQSELIYPLDESFHEYLKDESRMTGTAESISFPENEIQIAEILQEMRAKNTPVTIQGGRTGVVGGAVPLNGHIMNLSRMNRVQSLCTDEEGNAFLKVEPGLTLGELRRAIDRLKTPKALFWPPDPSEATATVGGIASTNARGICHHLYGDTVSYISGIRVMDAEGSVSNLSRGQETILMGGEAKDLLDVYLGGEGMYGVITELTLRLIPKPDVAWGIGFLFDNREDGMSFAQQLKASSFNISGANVAALEYLDQTIINAMLMLKNSAPQLTSMPQFTPPPSAIVYVEIHAALEKDIEEIAASITLIGSRSNVDPHKTWAFCGETEIDKMRSFLHTAAETVTRHIEKARCKDSRITKLGIDVNIDETGLKSLLHLIEKKMYEARLKAVYWGHIGSGRLHIDILPVDFSEFQKGGALIETWADRFPAFFGNAVTSYGIGKLKKTIYRKAVSKAYFEDMMRVKKKLDKHQFWNPGNMIDVY